MVFLEILKYTLPALIVMLTAILILHNMFKKERDLKKMEMVMDNNKIITPIRLQAYERISIFLERITPNSIIMRLQTPEMTVQKLHQEILELIRAEYEHNISQQIYLSKDAWDIVKTAKEKTIQLVNQAADDLDPNAQAIELSRAIFDKLIENPKAPTHDALDYLKKELQQIYS